MIPEKFKANVLEKRICCDKQDIWFDSKQRVDFCQNCKTQWKMREIIYWTKLKSKYRGD